MHFSALWPPYAHAPCMPLYPSRVMARCCVKSRLSRRAPFPSRSPEDELLRACLRGRDADRDVLPGLPPVYLNCRSSSSPPARFTVRSLPTQIRDLLTNFFNGKTPNTSINPDEAVAYGAAVQVSAVTTAPSNLSPYQGAVAATHL